ncbi:hypothetical protein D3C81_2217790 [compost metagenome]
MKTPGHLITFSTEFAAGMKDGKNYLKGRALRFLLFTNRDAAAVIDNGDAVILMNNNIDPVAITS